MERFNTHGPITLSILPGGEAADMSMTPSATTASGTPTASRPPTTIPPPNHNPHLLLVFTDSSFPLPGSHIVDSGGSTDKPVQDEGLNDPNAHLPQRCVHPRDHAGVDAVEEAVEEQDCRGSRYSMHDDHAGEINNARLEATANPAPLVLSLSIAIPPAPPRGCQSSR